MKEWFTGLNQREQLSLLVLGIALALYVVFRMLLAPLDTARDNMAAQNRGVSESLQRVDVMVSQIQQLQKGGAAAGARRNLTSLVNSSTAQHNLQVARLQPNSRGEIQVRLESAAFDDMVAWLYQMEHREGLVVHEASVTQAGSAGRVNVTVRLGPAG
ncbi:type II secretion system protein M [Mangrovimicrobium sediminis]|uniref:Type II secretion system protein M n=1 Tax=Mangrovimicrobium sediminis TaxID=2562682 RepID=A0A4Z0M335_9GAMM|nr:type II secretion system protein M [Haliea sp. SAOS-164]TGD74022.1 type II secretion system protein M [Haliea sp. SAOS-164]